MLVELMNSGVEVRRMTTQQAPDDGAVPALSRVQRKRGRRIQEILRVAAELLGERGYEAVSLEDVAERLDVTKGSLYYYFASKDELGAAAIETLGNEWTSRLEELPEVRTGSPGQRLRALISAQVTIAVRDYPAALRLFLVPDSWPPALRSRIKELRRRHDRLFRDIVTDGVTSGAFTVVSVDTTLRCMHAAMTQAPVWYADIRGSELDTAVAALTDTLMMLVGEAPT
jgi:AcrR family transcriptional regulator